MIMSSKPGPTVVVENRDSLVGLAVIIQSDQSNCMEGRVFGQLMPLQVPTVVTVHVDPHDKAVKKASSQV
jgi:hypothetical protein